DMSSARWSKALSLILMFCRSIGSTENSMCGQTGITSPGGPPLALSFSFCFRALRLFRTRRNTARAVETSRGDSPAASLRQALDRDELPLGSGGRRGGAARLNIIGPDEMPYPARTGTYPKHASRQLRGRRRRLEHARQGGILGQ